MLHLVPLAQALSVIALANGTPVLAKLLLGGRWVWPVDFGLMLPDGNRLLGDAKTWRGVLLA